MKRPLNLSACLKLFYSFFLVFFYTSIFELGVCSLPMGRYWCLFYIGRIGGCFFFFFFSLHQKGRIGSCT